MTATKCECSDSGCKCCSGKCSHDVEQTLFRIDMDDQTGTPMCAGCADDAFESGLYRGAGEEQDELSTTWARWIPTTNR